MAEQVPAGRPSSAGAGSNATRHGPRRRCRLRIEGRPDSRTYAAFVAALAARLELGGFVGTDAAGVSVEVEGQPAAVAAFLDLLRQAPADVDVERVTVSDIPCLGGSEFAVATGRPATARSPVEPDTAICAACAGELRDPGDRRYGYAFTSCAGCGPRFTLATGAGGGRDETTMAPFPMCARCRSEHEDPVDRRYRADGICCPDCGPVVFLADVDGAAFAGDPLAVAAALLTNGQVIAIKGTGGYQLCVDATSPAAVAALRSRLPAEQRPFALLCRDLAAVRGLCELDDTAAAALASRRRPQVLLRRLDPTAPAPAVAPGFRELAVALPSAGLLHLLCDAVRRPLVLIAADPGGGPVPRDNDDARRRLAGIADAFLGHDRRIRSRAPDSLIRIAGGRELPLRRGLGQAPEPLALPWSVPRPVLAVGTDAAGTPCLAAGRRAVLPPEPGDQRAPSALAALRADLDHLGELTGIRPRVIAHDPDPDALTTSLALDLAAGGVDLVAVPRAHAHIAACLADNGEWGPVIGVVLGASAPHAGRAAGGGELLVADLNRFTLAGHLDAVAVPAGGAPVEAAAVYLAAAVPGAPTAVAGPGTTTAAAVLVDAVAALLGLGDRASYPGQAAAELEQLADPDVHETYLVSMTAGAGSDPLTIRGADLVRGVVDDLRRGVRASVIAARFFNGLADAVVAAVELTRDTTGISTVALSGGLFGNAALLARVDDVLAHHGFRVLTHHRVPPGEGGVALGQALVAAATVA
jgi:hydrogenase maturation protein HypF